MPDAPASDPRKLKPALTMAIEIMGLLLEALRQEFSAGRWGAFEAAKGFLDGPAPGWVARAGASVRAAPESDADELLNRLRGAFLDLERACRAAMRLLQEEKRCRRDEVCAAEALASTKSHEGNLEDLREILISLAPTLSDPGLRQLTELAETPAPPEGSRLVHPAARLAGLLLLDADRRGASDVFAVPGSWVSLVQYRLGGALVPILELPLAYHRALVERFKGMAGLDISQHRRPQDGPAKPAEEGQEGAPRAIIRILPTLHGERLDVHLEGPPPSGFILKELGLSSEDLGRYEKLFAARGGLIVHAGLFGSGKRTAMLAALTALSREGRSALAMLKHNPGEVPGVSVSLAAAGAQEQLSLLKAALQRRPDAVGLDDLSEPDILREALQAAAGGILVLGTLPSDSAPDALRRLMEMVPDLPVLRRSLLAVCGHRLLRRLCSCHKLRPAEPDELSRLGASDGVELGRPVGCPACMHTGFRGLVPAFELWTMGKNLAPLLALDVRDEDWRKAAEADGMTPVRRRLVELVREGTTSLAEAARWGLSA
jgi:general secretion pathway protein E